MASQQNISNNAVSNSSESGGTVRLQSSEGKIFEVSLEVAKVSRMLSVMLNDLGHHRDDVIPLPNVNTGILKRVIAWAEHSVEEGLDQHLPRLQNQAPPTTSTTAAATPALHSPTLSTPPTSGQVPFQPRPQPHVPNRASSRCVLPPPSITLSQWEKDFLAHNKDKVYELLLAANYLDIKSLLDVLCRAIADIIKGRDPQEIRKAFHVHNSTGFLPDPPPTPPLSLASLTSTLPDNQGTAQESIPSEQD